MRRLLGFTLIEIVIGIVVLAIALGILTSFFVNQSKSSADPIHQVRAAELAQAVINEISGRSFDENSDHAGGVDRCDSSTCTAPASLGSDSGETSRDLYDDVDDYISTTAGSGACSGKTVTPIDNALGNDIAANYPNYCLTIEVFYDGNRDGVDDSAYASAKYIKVLISTPAKQNIAFASYRYNY